MYCVLATASRTANHGSEGTYGQFVPGVAAGQGLEGGGVVLHIDKGSTTRSNLGIVETDGSSVGVEIRLRDELGRPLGSARRMTIGPWESVQIFAPDAAVPEGLAHFGAAWLPDGHILFPGRGDALRSAGRPNNGT